VGALLTRRKATQQPQQNPQVDWQNPITRGLQAAFLPVGEKYMRDVAYGNAFDTNTGNFSGGANLVGSNVNNGGVRQTTSAPDLGGRLTLASYSILFIGEILNGGSYSAIFCKSGAAANGYSLQYDPVSSNVYSVYHGNNSVAFPNATFAKLQNTGPHAILMSFDATEQISRLYIDGALSDAVSNTNAQDLGAGRFVLFGERGETNTYGTAGACNGISAWNRKLSDAESKALTADVKQAPWQLFKPKSRRMFAGIAAGGNTAINPGAGTLVITGAAPTVSQSVNQQVNPGAGSLAFTGYAPVILQPQSLTSGTGALVLTGYAPAVTQLAGIAVNPGAGALTLTGYAPAIAQPRAISPSTGALTLTGYAPLITQAVNQQINPAVGNLALTGYAPTLTQSANTQLSPAAGTLAILGFAPSISQIVASPNLVPGVGALTLTGFAPSVGQTNIIAPRYAKPNADTATGAWVPSTGSSLYAMINETVEDDTTFIKATTATTCDVALNPVANPGTTSGQVVRYSAWSPFGNGLTVSLKQGATVIASWATAVLPVAPTLFEQNLTAAQIAAISDYGALHLSFASQ
jgi:hypothetical protein